MATDDQAPAVETPAPAPEAPAAEPAGEFDVAAAAMYGDDPPAETPEAGAPGEVPEAAPTVAPAVPDNAAATTAPEGSPAPVVATEAPEAAAPDAGQERWEKLVAAETAKRASQREAKNLVDMDQLRARADKDPIAVAEELGITYGALLEHLTEGTPPDTAADADTSAADSKVLAKLAKIEQWQQARDEQHAKDERQREQQSSMGAIAQLVGDRPACKAFESEAVPLALETAKQLCVQAGIDATPEIMPTVYAEALNRVEAYIAKREVDRIERQRLIPSVAQHLGAIPQAAPTPGAAPAPASGPTIGGGATPTAAPREKTEEELFDEAVEAMYS